MAGSAAEREMRDGVIPVLREHCPGARIVHELNIDHGKCRADLVAIEQRRITIVEIKSRKDTLDRLPDQVKIFGPACHTFIVVLDEKFFGERYAEQLKPFRYHSHELELWRWPRPSAGEGWQSNAWTWPRLDQHHYGVEPHAARLLELLWRDELNAECFRHRVAANGRTPRWPMIRDLAFLLTGKEIAEAVCRQLRQRHMAEGDPPTFEKALAA